MRHVVESRSVPLPTLTAGFRWTGLQLLRPSEDVPEPIALGIHNGYCVTVGPTGALRSVPVHVRKKVAQRLGSH